MTEVLFYHLERQPLERVLPMLLEKTLERGWRAVVQVGSQERLEAINTLLWTYRDDSFLPHGADGDGDAATQPIFLTTEDATPNGGRIRFLVDGADTATPETFDRVIYLFDGRDEEAIGNARKAWKRAKDRGLSVTYWQQTESGQWQKKA